ncbi:hypothetical protein Taro_012078 [Colocasia esculenta]|uniref:Uncharacterized protein n=1 Tax=Colocasia esculenta TaxID=4460 RepID=A0A843UI12_COLES|nr:hypothetical protein [Colocasia esculenta]
MRFPQDYVVLVSGCCDTALEVEVHRLVALCSGEVFPEPFAVVLSLRCAVGLAGAFWRVFPERCLGGSGGGSPRACLRCFYSSACCSVLSDGLCCLVVGLCILVKSAWALLVEVLCPLWTVILAPSPADCGVLRWLANVADLSLAMMGR